MWESEQSVEQQQIQAGMALHCACCKCSALVYTLVVPTLYGAHHHHEVIVPACLDMVRSHTQLQGSYAAAFVESLRKLCSAGQQLMSLSRTELSEWSLSSGIEQLCVDQKMVNLLRDCSSMCTCGTCGFFAVFQRVSVQ